MDILNIYIGFIHTYLDTSLVLTSVLVRQHGVWCLLWVICDITSCIGGYHGK